MDDDGTVGVWFNKRALALLEMPFRHNLRTKDGGWEVEVLTRGRLTAKFRDGHQERYDVEVGDTLFASGEEIYLALTRSDKAGQEGQAAGSASQAAAQGVAARDKEE